MTVLLTLVLNPLFFFLKKSPVFCAGLQILLDEAYVPIILDVKDVPR